MEKTKFENLIPESYYEYIRRNITDDAWTLLNNSAVEFAAGQVYESGMKASDILREQAYKLGQAMSALREIKNYGDVTASAIASSALKKISDYGQTSQDL